MIFAPQKVSIANLLGGFTPWFPTGTLSLDPDGGLCGLARKICKIPYFVSFAVGSTALGTSSLVYWPSLTVVLTVSVSSHMFERTELTSGPIWEMASWSLLWFLSIRRLARHMMMPLFVTSKALQREHCLLLWMRHLCLVLRTRMGRWQPWNIYVFCLWCFLCLVLFCTFVFVKCGCYGGSKRT